MTAVIGILNKRGIVLAADSAVTRRRGNNGKVTKNGDKLIRLSDVQPICVMITGNALLLGTPWEIIIRHYRQYRGQIKHKTVEDCMQDFFNYIANKDLFSAWDDFYRYIREELDDLLNGFNDQISEKLKSSDPERGLLRPKSYQKALIKLIKTYCDSPFETCPQFKDYTLKEFQKYSKAIYSQYINDVSYQKDDIFKSGYPHQLLIDLQEPLINALYLKLSSRCDRFDNCTELVFAGYGEEQEYPSLISALVHEGFDKKVNYHYRPEEIICISDNRHVAICPFAQKDVIRSILRGIHEDFGRIITSEAETFYRNFESTTWGIDDADDEIEIFELNNDFEKIKTQDLISHFTQQARKVLDNNHHKWEEALKNYDLQSMAALAESLIDLTGFHRILHFEQEGVGGPVDVAVISKNDGFTWLNRKSWYHHKDVNGQYGKLGV